VTFLDELGRYLARLILEDPVARVRLLASTAEAMQAILTEDASQDYEPEILKRGVSSSAGVPVPKGLRKQYQARTAELLDDIEAEVFSDKG